MADLALTMAIAATLILLGVVASKVSDRLGIPVLLLFLGIGMLAGSEGIGGIAFDDFEIAQDVGIVALAFILFAGGFETEWRQVKPVVWQAGLLATVGVFGTALLTGVATVWVFGVALVPGLLLGAIVSSTDAAAVFSVLRAKDVGLKHPLRPLLELESGSNDPMAVFLTVGLIELLTEPSTSVLSLVPQFVLQMGVGGLIGYGVARGSVALINRLRLGYEGLYPVVLIAIVLLTYGLTTMLQGSGFLAVYVAGIVLGDARLVHKNSLVRFSDGLAWLMQITMFLVLGLLVFPSQLWPVAGRALIIVFVLMFVARPLVTVALLSLARLPLRQTLLVSWVGLRGAVPIVLGTFPLVAGVPQGDVIFHVVFFIVLASVLFQGTTVSLTAERLGVAAPTEPDGVPPAASAGRGDLYEMTVEEDSPAADRRLVDLDLPQEALVVLVRRGDRSLVPQGSTVVRAGDAILLVAVGDSVAQARSMIEGEVD